MAIFVANKDTSPMYMYTTWSDETTESLATFPYKIMVIIQTTAVSSTASVSYIFSLLFPWQK